MNGVIMEPSDENIFRLMDMATDLIALAEKAVSECSDDGCLCLSGLVRDNGYRIKGEAERERKVHQALAQGAPQQAGRVCMSAVRRR